MSTATGCGDDDETVDGDITDGDTTDGDMTDGDTTDGDTVDGDTDPATTRIRALHLSPDAPAVDILVNGELRAIEDLAFQDSSDYLSVEAGSYDFDVVPADGTIGDSVLGIDDLELMADKAYTAVAFGTLANIGALALEDDLSDPATGSFRVRAIHAADGVGEVDIWNVTEGATPAIIYEDFDYGDVGAALELPAGEYSLGFDVDNDMTPDLVFDTGALPAGAIINLFAVKDGEAIYLLAQLSDGTTLQIDPRGAPATTRIRALHLSPDAPAVDILVNGELRAIEDLAFQDSSDYLSVEAGSYDFDVVPADGTIGDSVLGIDDLELMADKAYTAVAFGTLANIGALALEDDLSDPATGSFRVRAIHAADGVGEVDIWNVTEGATPAIIYEDFDYGDVGAALELPAGEYSLGFDVDNDMTPDLVFDTGALPAGAIINLFAVKDGEAIYLLAQLSDGTTLQIDPRGAPATTRIRALHLSPDAPAVDILVNGELRAIEDLAFQDSSDYLSVEAGSYDFDVVPADGTIGDSVLGIDDLELMADKAYTAVAFGTLANIGALALEDDLSDPATGSFRVRAIHAADGVGEVDIWNVTEGATPAIIYEDFDYGDVGAALELPAGEYSLGFDVDNDMTPDLVFDTGALPAGAIINLFAVKDGEAIYLLAQLSDGTTLQIDPRGAPATTRIRALHLSPDAPAVDILVNGELRAIEDLAFQDSSDYLSVEAGSYDFDVVPADGTIGDSVLGIDDLELMADKAYTAVAFGTLANIGALALEDDLSDPATGSFRVRAIHAADGVGEVDVWNVTEGATPAIIYEDFDYGDVGAALELPAGEYSLGFDVDNDMTPDLVFDTGALPAGAIINLFAVKDGEAIYLLAQLSDGTTLQIDPRGDM